MKEMRRSLIFLTGMVCAVMSSCQEDPYPIFFLSEAASTEGTTTKFVMMYRGHPYVRMPIVNHKHIATYRSFMNMQDGSYGAVFTLKPEMMQRLYAETVNREGMLILPVINGLAFDPLRIDRPIMDGKLVVWGGLNGYDLKRIADDIKPEDEEFEKKRFLKKNPRPLPKLTPKDTKQQKKDFTGRVIGEIYSSGTGR